MSEEEAPGLLNSVVVEVSWCGDRVVCLFAFVAGISVLFKIIACVTFFGLAKLRVGIELDFPVARRTVRVLVMLVKKARLVGL